MIFIKFVIHRAFLILSERMFDLLPDRLIRIFN